MLRTLHQHLHSMCKHLRTFLKLDMENICAVIVNCLPKIVAGQQITCFLNGKIWVESSILSCRRMYSYLLVILGARMSLDE